MISRADELVNPILDMNNHFCSQSKLTRFPQAHSNDVVLNSLCPPRRWSGAMVGIKMLRRIPLLENKKGFLVFGFLVSNKFYVFKRYLVHITKFPFHVFLLDMKYISNTFVILLNRSSSFVGARLFPNRHFSKSRYVK